MATIETLKIAKKLGNKVVIIGQSTGGLIASIIAAYYPELIDAIIIIEPALKVNSIKNWGACLGGKIPENLIRIAGYGVGLQIPKNIGIKMGCEVQKLANHFIHNPFAFNSDNNLDNYKLLAQRIKIPVLMFNNQFDNIVDSKINKSFFDSIMSHKQYVTINQFNTQPHGVFTYLSHELMEIESLYFFKDIFSDLLIDLIIKNKFYLYYGLNFEFSNYVNKKGNEIINYEQISYLFLNSGNTIEKYICRFNLDQKQCAEFKKHYLILKEFHLQNYHNNQFNEISEKSKYHLQRPNFESVQPSIEFMWNLTKAIF